MLTVVVPTLGRPADLQRCLAELAACDPPPGGFEVVVASGRADARMADVVDGARLERVRLLEGHNSRPDGPNRAVAAAGYCASRTGGESVACSTGPACLASRMR